MDVGEEATRKTEHWANRATVVLRDPLLKILKDIAPFSGRGGIPSRRSGLGRRQEGLRVKCWLSTEGRRAGPGR